MSRNEAVLVTVLLFSLGVAAGWDPELEHPESEPHALELSTYAHRWPDAHVLAHAADSAGLPRSLVFAVKWAESQGNVNPKLRGHHCKPAEMNACEWGAFQIRPRTARLRCPKDDIRTYRGNLHCFLRMATVDYAAGGAAHVLRKQIGGGLGEPYRRAYVERVFGIIGKFEVMP